MNDLIGVPGLPGVRAPATVFERPLFRLSTELPLGLLPPGMNRGRGDEAGANSKGQGESGAKRHVLLLKPMGE